MLKKTTGKLALSILGSSLISVVLTFIIILTFGSLGAKSASSSSSSAGSSASSSAASASSAGSSAVSSASSAAGVSLATAQTSGLIASTGGKIFLASLCILIFAALVYSTAWHEGDRDPNRVKYGHMPKRMSKGLVAGLLASIPYAALWLCFWISHAAAGGSVAAGVFEVAYRILNLQYVLISDAPLQTPALCFLFLLPLPLFSAAGYMVGYRHFALLPRLVYKNRKQTKKQTPGYTIRKAKSAEKPKR